MPGPGTGNEKNEHSASGRDILEFYRYNAFVKEATISRWFASVFCDASSGVHHRMRHSMGNSPMPDKTEFASHFITPATLPPKHTERCTRLGDKLTVQTHEQTTTRRDTPE